AGTSDAIVATAGTSSDEIVIRAAQSGLREEFQVNTYTSSDQTNPSSTVLADGSVVVTWQSYNYDQEQPQSNWDIGVFGKRYDTNGKALGEEFQINTHTTSNQTVPSVTALDDGGFAVTWTSDGGHYGGSSSDIYAKTFTVTDASGNPVGTPQTQVDEFLVNGGADGSTTVGNQRDATIASLKDGGFAITWEDQYNHDGSGEGIYGQRFHTDGSRDGGEFQINTHTSSDQSNPAVATLEDGGFVVTWQSNNQEAGSNDLGIFAQRYDKDGTAVGSEFQVNSYTSNNQYEPSVAGLTGGGFVVTWQDSSGHDGGSGDDIRGQIYTKDGTTVGTEFRVNSYTSNTQNEPDVTALPDGGFVVTWQSDSQDGSYYGIYGQRYDKSGATFGDEFQVNTYTSSHQYDPSVTALADGGFMVTWESSGQDGSNYGIYGQRFAIDGSTEQFFTSAAAANNAGGLADAKVDVVELHAASSSMHQIDK
ncbi:MAG: hypothetical protein VYC03_09080, partial [Pseudomonadota bacterium]|nr:hypothetical protein [Pseudomonadota bacterium]